MKKVQYFTYFLDPLKGPCGFNIYSLCIVPDFNYDLCMPSDLWCIFFKGNYI